MSPAHEVRAHKARTGSTNVAALARIDRVARRLILRMTQLLPTILMLDERKWKNDVPSMGWAMMFSVTIGWAPLYNQPHEQPAVLPTTIEAYGNTKW